MTGKSHDILMTGKSHDILLKYILIYIFFSGLNLIELHHQFALPEIGGEVWPESSLYLRVWSQSQDFQHGTLSSSRGYGQGYWTFP